MPAEFRNLLDGLWVDSRSGRRLERRSPVDGSTPVAVFPDSDAADAAAAVVTARRSFEDWRLSAASDRQAVLLDAAGALGTARDRLVERGVRETGLTPTEVTGDLTLAVTAARRSAAAIAGGGPDSGALVTNGETRLNFRAAGGVTALFTSAVPSYSLAARLLFPALAAGNTVILKPAEEAAGSASGLLEALVEAGCPAGVVNLLHGSAERAGAALAAHPDVRILAMAASPAAGLVLARQAAEGGKRALLAPRARSAMIVLDDADLDGAVEVALAAGFGYCGQGPGSVARILVQRKVSQSFIDRLVASAAAFRTADPSSPGAQMGPLLTRERQRRAMELIESARRAGGRVATGGGAPADLGSGWFLLPTVLVDMRPSMPVAADHRPGPVVSVLVVDSLEEAIHVLNHALPGLSSSVHTRDVGRVHRVLRDLETPDIVLNGPPAAAGGAMVLPTGATVGSADEPAWIRAMSESRTAVLTAGTRRSVPPPEFD